MYQKNKIIRNKNHLKFLSELPCCVCGSYNGVVGHHIRMGNNGGIGLKPSDELAVCVCYMCHHKIHNGEGEKSFWGEYDPMILAHSLYRCSLDYGVWHRRARALMAINRWKRNGKKNIHTDE